MARTCEVSGVSTRYGSSTKHKRGSSGAGGVWRFKGPKTKRNWAPNLRLVMAQYTTPTGKQVVGKVKVAMKIYKKMRTGASVNGYKLAA